MNSLSRLFTTILWLIAGPSIAAAQPSAAETPPPTNTPSAIQSQINRAIRQLGADEFSIRQAAQAELIQIGPPAIADLTAATSDPNAEIRSRSHSILQALKEIQHQQARAAMEVKLARLVGDSWKEHRHEFPLWEKYQDLAGTSPAARQVFAMMQRADQALLQTVVSDPQEVADMIQQRLQRTQINRILGHRNPLPLGQILAMLLATTDPDVIKSSDDTTIVVSLYSVIGQSELPKGLSNRQQAPVLRQILGSWIKRDDQAPGNTHYYKMTLATRYNVKQGLDVALKVIRDPVGKTQSYVFSYGILTIAKLGDEQHLKPLESLLTNKTILHRHTRKQANVKTEVRDVALAALVHITKQDHKQYGFAHLKRSTPTVFLANTLGFSDNETKAREAAIRKWQRWSAGQPREK